MRIRIIFTDIDGTLLSHRTGRVPESAIQAVKCLQAKGIQIWGCTGRHTLELQKLPLQGFQPDGWILMNGAYCVHSGHVIQERPLLESDVSILIKELEKDPFPVQFLESDFMYLNMVDDTVRKGLAAIHSQPDPVEDVHRALQHKLYMVIPWTGSDHWNRIAAKMKNVKTIRWNKYAADCLDKDCGKDTGIAAVLKYFDIAKEDSFVIGDAANDIPMFQAAGISACMANGTPEAKKAADFVTDDIDQDGLAKAVQKVLG